MRQRQFYFLNLITKFIYCENNSTQVWLKLFFSTTALYTISYSNYGLFLNNKNIYAMVTVVLFCVSTYEAWEAFELVHECKHRNRKMKSIISWFCGRGGATRVLWCGEALRNSEGRCHGDCFLRRWLAEAWVCDRKRGALIGFISVCVLGREKL